MQEIKKILKMMNSVMLHKLFKLSGLTDEEYKLLRMCFISNDYKDKICDTLNIGRTTYNNIKNQALLKVQLTLDGLLNEKTAQLNK